VRPLIGLTTSLSQTEGKPHGDRIGVSARYCQALAAAGGDPLLIPCLGDPELLAGIFPLLDGLLFTGGPDINPRRYGREIAPGCEWIDEQRDVSELALIALAKRSDIPLLGICRGIQLINVGFGGTLLQDINTELPGSQDHRASIPVPPTIAHSLAIAEGSRLARIVGSAPLLANTLHHQAVDDPAPGFVVSALSEDGVVEGIEQQSDRFVVAVQCHPEHLYLHDERWLDFFRAFVREAARVGAGRALRSA
jgi:putative glutamine amidotransferase